MKPASPSSAVVPPDAFADGLGVRVRLAEKAGEELEVLRLTPEFVSVPAFEFALRERVGRLANFRHAYYARVRRVDRLDNGSVLGIVSEHASGVRLSHVLAIAEHHKLDLDINAALCLLRQLVPAIAMLHQNAREVAHGALAAERILITPHARVVITDYVLGSAIDQLRLSRERLWRDLRIAVPPGAGTPRLDHRADVMQVGAVALSLVLGRRLGKDELRFLPDLVGGATENTALGDRAPISAALRQWLLRSLQADPRGSYESAAEAQQGLEEVLSGEGGYIAAPIALETFLTRYQECAVLGLMDEDDLRESATPPPATSPTITTPQAAGAAAPRSSDSVSTTAADPPSGRVALPQRSNPASGRVPVARPNDPPSGRVTVARRQEPPSGRVLVAAPSDPPPARVPVSNAGQRSADIPLVVQPLAEAPQPRAEPARPTRQKPARAVAPDPVADAQRELSREIAAAHAAEHMFGMHEPVETSAPSQPRARDVVAETRLRTWQRIEHVTLVIVLAIAIGEGAFIWWAFLRDASLFGEAGRLAVDSRPVGIPVVVDGEARGTTPLNIKLKEGAHVLELRAGTDARVLPITIRAGETYAQYLELPSVRMNGTLDIRESPGARVFVDGQLRGTSPMKVADLVAGSHDVVIDGRARVRQTVTIEAGATTTLGGNTKSGVSPGAAAPSASGTGWVAVNAPYEMQVVEAGRVVGTTSGERLALPAGRHELDIVSATLNFRQTKTVEVGAGQVAAVSVDLPRGTLVLEADVPAEVTVDGEKVGTTPLANLPVTIGPHEIVFTHPQFGEQRHAVSVTLGVPVRLSIRLQPMTPPQRQD
jgi:hypothetical protein